ncbi:hypothetical protein CHARACLAT_028273 [Characodon lateralis]|uniref:Uncharacterized protein n=1 Tax=Characodon lateralis TaxID=208331 RepID=A0ABU7CS18_9TELE|nr:hypothetical protein [Characodon lateralis]
MLILSSETFSSSCRPPHPTLRFYLHSFFPVKSGAPSCMPSEIFCYSTVEAYPTSPRSAKSVRGSLGVVGRDRMGVLGFFLLYIPKTVHMVVNDVFFLYEIKKKIHS